MENYIKKINDKLIESGNEKNAKHVKFLFQLTGGLSIAIGLAGFLASFITFLVLFLKFKTDDAFIAWIVAVPFLILIIVGSVLARIGDMLLPKNKTKIDGLKDSLKEIHIKDIAKNILKDKTESSNKNNPEKEISKDTNPESTQINESTETIKSAETIETGENDNNIAIDGIKNKQAD